MAARGYRVRLLMDAVDNDWVAVLSEAAAGTAGGQAA